MKTKLSLTGWMNKSELAAYVGRDVRTITRWVACQVLPPGELLGGRRYWHKDIVDKWLKRPAYAADCERLYKIRQVLDKAAEMGPPAA